MSGNFVELTSFPSGMRVELTGFFDRQFDVQDTLSGTSPTNFGGYYVGVKDETNNPYDWIEGFSTCESPTIDKTVSAYTSQTDVDLIQGQTLIVTTQ